jgi:23S rRNA pseudouridine1911/1915/1917 synthase
MQMEIIYQDQDIVVINKPAGLVVNQSETVKGETVQSWFESQMIEWDKVKDISSWSSLIPDEFDPSYGEPETIFQVRGGVVHRLDKQTSGVLVLAKNPGSLINLMVQFKLRQTEKQYLALTHGLIDPPEGTINAPLKRHFRQRQKIAVDASGRQALTWYQVKQYYQFRLDKLALLKLKPNQLKKLITTTGKFSLVKAQPKTGRMHQIRVHLAHIGHPLVADDKYVGRKRYKLDKLWCPRHFLHASWLKLMHPRTHQEVSFEARLSDDLNQALNYLMLE